MTNHELSSSLSPRFAPIPRRSSLLRARRSSFFAVAASAAISTSATFSAVARADDTITTPGAHPDYPFEIEPHLAFADDGIFGSAGYGVGARVGIPIVKNGFVPSINNSVAITFGADIVHYDACYFNNVGCGATYLLLPVALQWNFYVARQFSVFGEPGLFLYKGFESDFCPGGTNSCSNPSTFGARPALSIGGRWHFSDKLALTARVGYPTVSIGLSIF